MLLNQDTSIGRVCCFVGVTSLGQILRRNIRLYSQTIQALITEMRDSRWGNFTTMAHLEQREFDGRINRGCQIISVLSGS